MHKALSLNNQKTVFMRNLLEIETGFLSLDAVQTGLRMTEIKAIQRSLNQSDRRIFDKQMQLCKLYSNATNWFDKPETKQLLLREGIAWTKSDFPKKAFDISYSRFTRMVKAWNISADVKESFVNQAKQLQNQGYAFHTSIDNLNKYNKFLEINPTGTLLDMLNQSEESVARDTSDTDDTATDDTTTEDTTSDTIFTMVFKDEWGDNVSVRYAISEGLVTTNTPAEIRNAISFLQEQLNNI
jgi:hypothetical protein